MKLSINWLNTYFIDKPKWDDIFYKLTMAGIEVEDIEVLDNDQVVEFKITPNRGDVLSILGLLREISVLTDCHTHKPAQNIDFKSSINDKMATEVINPEACPNYQTLIIRNVNNTGTLPDEIIHRITTSGNRSISPIVDIANYVMLELGQPMHAFDLHKVGNKLRVRFARADESLKLLVGTEAKLTEDTLVICDSNNEPAAIAGVMGGAHSGVNELTTDIVLESAFFSPNVIAGKTKYYGINSESAYRFERGVDPKLQDLAIRYAASLILKYCGGEIGHIALKTNTASPKQISVGYAEINRLIGADISKDTVNDILLKLGFTINSFKYDETLIVTLPGHRFDIAIKEDIVEEIARIYGYDNIPAQIPIARYTMGNVNSNFEQILKTRLVNLGYSEIIGYAFLEEKLELLLGDSAHNPVRLQNPIANLNVMRTSLIADLIKTLQHNLNYGHKRLKIFELARVFHGETKEQQPLKLAGLIYGDYADPSWLSKSRSVDFYDLRNDVEILLDGLCDMKFVVCENNSIFHSGRCAKIVFCDTVIGIIGQLHPKYKAEFGLSQLPYLFELDVNFIVNQKPLAHIREVSKFQKVERDLAFLINAKANVGDVLQAILNAKIPYLLTARVFDIYQGEKLADIKLNDSYVKSVAINFLFQGNKTLNEEDINTSMAMVKQYLLANFIIQFRI